MYYKENKIEIVDDVEMIHWQLAAFVCSVVCTSILKIEKFVSMKLTNDNTKTFPQQYTYLYFLHLMKWCNVFYTSLFL